MKSRLTPHFIDLVYDAAFKSFWRKAPLERFIRNSGVPDARIAEGETKRDFLSRVVDALMRSDRGQGIVLTIARNLIDQKTFPDLNNWEDSDRKISDAKTAVAALRKYQREQEEEIESAKDKSERRAAIREQREATALSQQSLQTLRERLDALGEKLGSQDAGYAFQDWFYNFLDFYDIQNRKPYVQGGRQIDGSLTLSGTTYLVETKFTRGQADAPDIDTFYKKVTTKADNTMGVMVSISGYSSVAIKEASATKTPLLLFDFSHLYLALSGVMGWADIIERVRRHASQTGEAFLTAGKFSG